MSQNKALMILCKTLDKASEISSASTIELTRQKVREFINEDKDKFLQLKAEVKDQDGYTVSSSHVFSIMSFTISTLAFLNAALLVDEMEKFLIAITLIFDLGIGLGMLRRVNTVNKWKKYILVVLDEFEQK